MLTSFFRSMLLVMALLLMHSCNDDAPDISYVSEAQTIFYPGTVYAPGMILRGLFQPTVVSTASGTLIVFAQGRINSSEDDTDKVLIMSRSEDQGRTWSATEFLTMPGSFWGITAFTSYDESSGSEKINILLTYSKPKLFGLYDDSELLEHFNLDAGAYDEDDASILYQLTSLDNGLTWDKAAAYAPFMNAYNSNGKYVGFFSCVGQTNRILDGPNAGRILAAGPVKYADQPINDPDDIYDYPTTTSAVIFSDDEGMTWQMSGFAPHGGNEASVAAINGGEALIMVRRRNADYNGTKRIANLSYDAGANWMPNEDIEDLASPKCLGVLYDDGNRLVYSTPNKEFRVRGWIGYSTDDGKSWQGKVLEPGFFSYSDLTRINGSDLYLVAYSQIHHGELGLAVRTFNQDWLLK